MQHRHRPPPASWPAGLLAAPAADLVACVVAALPNNPTYHGTATTITKLKCEFTRQDYYPTLGELYRQGWRLIEVMGGELALLAGDKAASPLYFLEREQSQTAGPAPGGPTPGGAISTPAK